MKRAHPYSYYTSPGGIYGDNDYKHDEGEEVARKRRLVSSFEGLSLSSSSSNSDQRPRRWQQQQQPHEQSWLPAEKSPGFSSPGSTPPASPVSYGDSDTDANDTDDDGIILSSHVPNLVLDRLLASMTARRYADPAKPGADPTTSTAGNRYTHFYERWWTTALVPRATVFSGSPTAPALVKARFIAYLARLQHEQEGADYDYIGDCDVDMDFDDDKNGETQAGYAYTPPPRCPPDDDNYDYYDNDNNDDSMDID
ncbi:hypothetical protein D0Z00_002476 [Geotrichum galactomycetum]|uniref:Uncharacterized protein n=1 Tax=Geotrichum galactomycetum TaxID=27317 RepID=A0ACB6V401_9ASCO|nr:hypothetical protein D0Z00_002476 [Geotrichum candidum]